MASASATWARAHGEGDPDKVLPLYADDAVLWGTLSPKVRADRGALRDYFVAAFKVLKSSVDALYVCTEPVVFTNVIPINILAAAARVPTMHARREYVEAGGLMSYGANYPDLFRRAAEYVDKILRGAKPSDIPVEQPTKFDLVINMTTAKALGIEVPPTLLARADEVIE